MQELHARGIPSAVCGGLAFAIHVHPRATVDVDLFIRAADIPRSQEVLLELGYKPHPRRLLFAEGAVVIHRFRKPQAAGADVLTIDLLVVNEHIMPGVWASREEVRWADLPVSVVSRQGLRLLKSLRGSKQDLADIERLQETEGGMRDAASPKPGPTGGCRDIGPVIRQVSELRALCLSLREARNRVREAARAAEFRGAIEREDGVLPADPGVIRAGLRDLWIRGEYERIALLRERIPAKVLEADEVVVMYLSCAEDFLRGGPAPSKTA